MVNNKFQGPLPKGTTKKEERIFRETGITLRKVKKSLGPKLKKRKSKSPKRLIRGFERALRFQLPKVTKLTRKQISTKLLGRREQTLQKIIDSPQASPISKMRARRLLRI